MSKKGASPKAVYEKPHTGVDEGPQWGCSVRCLLGLYSLEGAGDVLRQNHQPSGGGGMRLSPRQGL